MWWGVKRREDRVSGHTGKDVRVQAPEGEKREVAVGTVAEI